MRAALVGCGSWGSRVAERLAQLDVTLDLFDADRHRALRLGLRLNHGAGVPPLECFRQYLDEVVPDAIILAVPPGARQRYVDAVCDTHRRPVMLRIEKPLAMSRADAVAITEQCATAGVELSVGFTLLHDPLYQRVFDWVTQHDSPPTALYADRAGPSPAHCIDPMLDTGIHAAAVAAYLRIPAEHTTILATHDRNHRVRQTLIRLADGARIVVDELERIAVMVGGEHTRIRSYYGDPPHVADALGAELRAWIDGTHRGKPQVAIHAHDIVEHTGAAA